MNFNDYQDHAHKSSKSLVVGHSTVYPALGLAGAAGGVADKVKKIFRDKDGLIDNTERENLERELGDVLWHVAEIATQLEVSLDDIAKRNIERTLTA